jgi:hypothetical protein
MIGPRLAQLLRHSTLAPGDCGIMATMPMQQGVIMDFVDMRDLNCIMDQYNVRNFSHKVRSI